MTFILASILSFCGLCGISASAGNRDFRQAQDHRPLGSLTAVGPVFINGSPVPAESTVFSGDALSTTANSSATFTISGKGSYKIGPQSQVSFTGDPQYVAELKLGTVVMSSFAGNTDVTIRAGNFVVGPVIQTQQSTSEIEKEPDGSFNVVCLDGSVGLVPLVGTTGRVLQARQAVAISPSGDLDLTRDVSNAPQTAQATASPQTAQQPSPPAAQSNNNNRKWIILALVGGGAAAGIAAAAGHGGGSPPVSPSGP